MGVNIDMGAQKFQHTATRRWLLSNPLFNALSSACFNTQPPEGGCLNSPMTTVKNCEFQHTATRRWLRHNWQWLWLVVWFQHTATRRWLLRRSVILHWLLIVSTHSHPKVAAACVNIIDTYEVFQHTATRRWLLPT